MLESEQKTWDFHKKIGDVTSVSPHPSERILSSTLWARPNSWSIIISYRSHATVAMQNNIFRIIFYDFHILSMQFLLCWSTWSMLTFYLLAPNHFDGAVQVHGFCHVFFCPYGPCPIQQFDIDRKTKHDLKLKTKKHSSPFLVFDRLPWLRKSQLTSQQYRL